jgi:hypothetical protein
MISTVCAFIWGVVGVVYLIRLCRPFDKWKSSIVALCVLGLILSAIFFNKMFSIELGLNISSWVLFGIATLLAFPVMRVMKVVFEKASRVFNF